MARRVTVAAAQMGGVHLADRREAVVGRLMAMMREAAAMGARVVVFPELALTTFFPRYWYDEIGDIDAWFEREMPNQATRPLFELAAELRIGFHLGYAELTSEGGSTHRYNTAILVGPDGGVIGKYRKIHLPGHADHRENIPFQHLEKRYFEVGDLGFPVWRAFGGICGMMICNDRRWPESYRVMGLKGVELIMLGYNTPTHLHAEMTFNELALLGDYRLLLQGEGLEVTRIDDLGPLWTGILEDRLAMYRSLEGTTTEKFGRAHFERWDQAYSFFVRLFGECQFTCARIIARRPRVQAAEGGSTPLERA